MQKITPFLWFDNQAEGQIWGWSIGTFLLLAIQILRFSGASQILWNCLDKNRRLFIMPVKILSKATSEIPITC